MSTLNELAWKGARSAHIHAAMVPEMHVGTPFEAVFRQGHFDPFETCPHEDCQLVHLANGVRVVVEAQPFSLWHEDDHDVLWWHFPVHEPPYVGSPLCDDWPFEEDEHPQLGWTRLVVPEERRA